MEFVLSNLLATLCRQDRQGDKADLHKSSPRIFFWVYC